MIGLLGWGSSFYFWHRIRRFPVSRLDEAAIALSFESAAALSVTIWWKSMRSGVRALEEMDRTPG